MSCVASDVRLHFKFPSGTRISIDQEDKDSFQGVMTTVGKMHRKEVVVGCFMAPKGGSKVL
jgi:hypothetical protein